MEKRKKRKNAPDSPNDDPWKPTKLETEVTNYLYRKVSTKDGRLSGIIVHTFCGNDAVDVLLESPWAKAQPGDATARNSKPLLFTNQLTVVSFMNTLIQKRMFHRAIKTPKKAISKRRDDSKSLKSKSKKSLTDMKSSRDLDADQFVPISEKSPGATSVPSEDKALGNSVVANGPVIEPLASPSKSSKPMRLELSTEQAFVLDDPLTVYVWIYEPPPGLFNWLAGGAVLLAIIICCLFPVWPTQLRSGTYYLTLCASGLFGLLIALALIRLGIYLCVWLCTLGKYAFWLFPNYFEDCGFFESFRPVYSLSLCNAKCGTKKDKNRLKSNGTRNQPNSGLTNSTSVFSDDTHDALNKLD